MSAVLDDVVTTLWPNAAASAAPLGGVASLALLAALGVTLVLLAGRGHRTQRAMDLVYRHRDLRHADGRRVDVTSSARA